MTCWRPNESVSQQHLTEKQHLISPPVGQEMDRPPQKQHEMPSHKKQLYSGPFPH